MSIPDVDARHLASLTVDDLFDPTDLTEPLIICFDILQQAILGGYRRLLVGDGMLAWSDGPVPAGSLWIPASVRSLVPEILSRDPVLARHVLRREPTGEIPEGAADEYEIR